MNIYDRIINILLEARVEMFIQDRLDEGMVKARNKAMKNKFTDSLRHHEAPPNGRSGQINLSPREGEAAENHAVRLARKVKFPTHASEKRAVGRDNLRKGDTYRADEARYEAGKKIKAGMPKKGGLTPPVKAYIRDMRAGDGDNPNVGAKKPGETGIDLMNRRQQAHIDSRGKKKPKP